LGQVNRTLGESAKTTGKGVVGTGTTGSADSLDVVVSIRRDSERLNVASIVDSRGGAGTGLGRTEVVSSLELTSLGREERKAEPQTIGIGGAVDCGGGSRLWSRSSFEAHGFGARGECRQEHQGESREFHGGVAKCVKSVKVVGIRCSI
jgi:hypothetical protein